MKAFVTLQWLLVAVLIVSIPLLSLACGDETVNIGGNAMAPTLTKGQSVAIDRNAYESSDPERGDIILIRVAQDQGIPLRIVGLPGEMITIENGAVYVNGTLLDEPYLPPGTITESDTANFNVPIHSYFVLGDNRAKAADSRQDFFVHPSTIIAKIML